ncbi:MAG: bifunctional oligoribonuclease/PAP phosphatase NrnA [Patescibacteria group bacterium]|nr:bifunctional oligoribonuclease/PAP phosphatase NrnA [Patescibacteria group bacterium]
MEEKTYGKKIIKLRGIFEEAGKVALLTHKQPDGDALGSTLALKFYLENQGKRVKVFYSGEMEENLSYLPGFDEDYFYEEGYEIKENFDLAVICDAGETRRVGISIRNLDPKSRKLVFIDHHTNKTREECLLEIARRDSAATSMIVYDYFLMNRIDFSRNIATCLLTGIFTDTGGFKHANTDSRVMQAASELMRRGACLSLIAKKNFSNKKINTLKVWGRALERAKLNNRSKMAFSYITQNDLKECGASIEDLSGVTNILGSAEESVYSLFLAETENHRLKGSLRSEEYKNCDVSEIAKMLGGGGHKLASGFELEGKIKKDKDKGTEVA